MKENNLNKNKKATLITARRAIIMAVFFLGITAIIVSLMVWPKLGGVTKIPPQKSITATKLLVTSALADYSEQSTPHSEA